MHPLKTKLEFKVSLLSALKKVERKGENKFHV